nr:MAG TPA: hypothetical protein [Caudoviricetes sp.]
MKETSKIWIFYISFLTVGIKQHVHVVRLTCACSIWVYFEKMLLESKKKIVKT